VPADPAADPAERLARAEQRVAAMQDIGRALASTLDLDELLQLIMRRVTDLMEADRSTLYLLDAARGELWSRVLQGAQVRSLRFRVGEGVAGWVAEHGAPLNLADAYADARFNPDVDRASGYRTRSILCLPLFDSRGAVAGVIQVLNKRGGPFSADDEALLAALCGQAAIALENARLYESVKRRNRELDLLYAIEREVSAAASLEEMVDRLIAHGLDLCDAEAGAILLRDRDGAALYYHAGGGPGRLRLEAPDGVVGWVATHGEPARSDDPSAHPRYSVALAARTGIAARNLACVPLADDEGPFGAVELSNKRGGSFDDEDVRRLALIAGQAARAVRLWRSREERQKSDRLAAIGQMISGVLHDLRSPMTIVSGYAQMMANIDDPAKRREHIEQILRQLDLMGAMGKEVLAFARGESGVLVRKVYLQHFVKDIAEHLRHEFAGRGVELAVDARYDGVAHFDELKLRRVVQNIARNAAQAMPQGGRFTLSVAKADADLVIELGDDGPGIPADMEGRMFEAFATSGKKGGTGLGLAIVKKIVDEHHGRIAYRSSPEGTTFVIRLPLEKPAA
jgi:signal transduction histidine kinase